MEGRTDGLAAGGGNRPHRGVPDGRPVLAWSRTPMPYLPLGERDRVR
ncbi:MAG TPA: hypothetical protein VK942_14730 [Actinomycetes bacterium]|nr:hypothetical protein [Actinomycetes bacterium]